MSMPLEGDKAPLFTGNDQHGKKVALKDYRGKKVALYFYPEYDTPTCTIQACNLRDNFTLLKKRNIEIIGVSPDDSSSHLRFREKFQLPFMLIGDPRHAIINKYGVWGPKKLYGRNYQGLYRTTFLIDEKGVITKIFRRPKNKAHAEEILAAAFPGEMR